MYSHSEVYRPIHLQLIGTTSKVFLVCTPNYTVKIYSWCVNGASSYNFTSFYICSIIVWIISCFVTINSGSVLVVLFLFIVVKFTSRTCVMSNEIGSRLYLNSPYMVTRPKMFLQVRLDITGLSQAS